MFFISSILFCSTIGSKNAFTLEYVSNSVYNLRNSIPSWAASVIAKFPAKPGKFLLCSTFLDVSSFIVAID